MEESPEAQKNQKKFSSHAADAASAIAAFHAPPRPLPLPPGVTISQLPSKLRPVSKKGNTFKKSINIYENASNTKVESAKAALGMITAPARPKVEKATEPQVKSPIAEEHIEPSIPCSAIDTNSTTLSASVGSSVHDSAGAKDEEHFSTARNIDEKDQVHVEEQLVSASSGPEKGYVKPDRVLSTHANGECSQAREKPSEQDLVDSQTAPHWMTSDNSFDWDGDDVLFCRSDDDDTENLAKVETEKPRVLWVCRPGGDLGMEESHGKSPEEIDSMLVGALQELLPDWESLKIECDELFHATKGEEKGRMSSEDLYDLTQKLIDRFGCREEAVLDRIGLIYTTVAAAFEDSDGMSVLEFRGYVASVLTQILHELESRGQEQTAVSPEGPVVMTGPAASEEFSENPLAMLTNAFRRIGLATTDIAKAFVGLAPQEQQEPRPDFLDTEDERNP